MVRAEMLYARNKVSWGRFFYTGGSEEKSREFCTIEYEDRTWERDAEESPLLEAVAMERLVKIRQAVKNWAGAVVICELWRLAVAQ
jgi:hypothetical protein